MVSKDKDLKDIISKDKDLKDNPTVFLMHGMEGIFAHTPVPTTRKTSGDDETGANDGLLAVVSAKFLIYYHHTTTICLYFLIRLI